MTSERRSGAPQAVATAVLVFSGLGAALAAASCCALPPLFIWAGVAGLWTLELQSFFGPHQHALLWLAVGGLGAGAVTWVWQMRKACTTGCWGRGVGSHLLTLLGLIVGSLLTWFAISTV
jgi:mercuric ion transport protein